jgi:uncharacterized Zn-binding protein involved in type VI secretion
VALTGKIVAGSFDVEINAKQAARKTDLTDHGGVIAGGCATVVVNGAAFVAARLGDPVSCPSPDDGGHVGSLIVLGSPNVIIGGQFAARQDDPVLCGSGGAGGGGGDGGGGGGGDGGEPAAETECQKLWKKYDDEAKALLAPGKDHRERNKIISGAYADLYLKNPDFKWAGLAAYASKQVGCAMDFAKERAGTGKPANPYHAVHSLSAELQDSYQYTYDMLGIGNRALFLDVYPLHRFFQEQGFAKLAKCGAERRPPVNAQAMDAFRAMDLYRKTGDKKYLDQSVKSLAYHEQVSVLQREIYSRAHMQNLLWSNELVDVPGANSPAAVIMGSGCEDPTGGSQTLKFAEGGRSKIYDVAERMDWILNHVARNYNGFAGSKRHIDDLQEIRKQGSMAGGDYH